MIIGVKYEPRKGLPSLLVLVILARWVSLTKFPLVLVKSFLLNIRRLIHILS